MAEYFIGMHNHFDLKKFQRDYIPGLFSGIEFCNFTSHEEIEEIVSFTRLHKIKMGIHFPLNQGSYKYRDPHLLSLDPTERAIAWDGVRCEIDFAKKVKAEYLLLHFPKPMVLDIRLGWEKCRFTEADTPISEGHYPYETFKANANKQIKILYEHRSDRINDEELHGCYQWVSSFFEVSP